VVIHRHTLRALLVHVLHCLSIRNNIGNGLPRIETMLLAAAVSELLLFDLASIQLLAAADVILYDSLRTGRL
jgi:hypothetical protein